MPDVELNGNIYNDFLSRQREGYPPDAQHTAEQTVRKLLEQETSSKRPGMFLGRIQSGKTKTFIGVIALAFDNGYDVALVLTKGTKALSEQTLERLNKEYEAFIAEDRIQVFDIMHLPPNLTDYEREHKLILVCKKETKNLARLHRALLKTYPDLARKKVLFIDDEADFASIGFTRSKKEGRQINRIASQIDNLRKELGSSSFLQVTATPYSLYLQPEDLRIEEKQMEFRPVRPAFTVLVPVADGYVGGNYYFEESTEEDALASHTYVEVPPKELGILQRPDRRVLKLDGVLTSKAIQALRRAIVTFIVGGCIRNLQKDHEGKRRQKFSFIVHTETRRDSHAWQREIVETVVAKLKEAAAGDVETLDGLVESAYDDLSKSVRLLDLYRPPLGDLREEVTRSLRSVMVTTVNSERDAAELLDNTGQLKLRNPLNIFIGGQILDRGLTIGNVIGFFYGRNPARVQQDTVLQHSRMYGYRPKDDLSVTRFYTTARIYDVMRRIHEIDTALREAFERGGHEEGVVFIHKDAANEIIPCSPNKILLSTTTTLRPGTRLLPVGFQTGYKTYITKTVTEIDRIISAKQPRSNPDAPFLIDLEVAKTIIDTIAATLEFGEEGYDWDVKAFKAAMEYLSRNTSNTAHAGKLWCLVRRDRNLTRRREEGRFQNAPDTPHVEGEIAKQAAIDIPILMLFRQNGREEDGWRNCPFWWPVLRAPRSTPTVIYASETAKDEALLP
jgi:hypothetical protein